MWEDLSSDEQIEFLANVAGFSADTHLSHELIYAVEGRLTTKQREQYVDWISGFVADATYRLYDPADPMTAIQYYFNLMRVELELRGKLLWHAIKGIQP